ncbi:hypothetical protein ACIHAA_10175 [Streptomyces sp. NPDC052040]|uniref:hypothetical protein n=1 Tax=Streptomyces sp. NPDC052040 TaxID=3365682 RepID=UPI0037D8EB8E
MRIRATVAAVSGALALSALAVPAAHAAAGTAGPAVTFSNVKVAQGKSIVVGAKAKVVVPVTYTLTHPASLKPGSFAAGPVIYLGDKITAPTGFQAGDEPGTCKTVSATVLNCTASLDIYPTDHDLLNSQAGTWKVGGLAVDAAKHLTWGGDLGYTKVLRGAALTVDASPEPVKKGAALTVKGTLSRADWSANKNTGFAGQSVALQFCKAGSRTYTTVKTVKTDGAGNLKTTVTASVDGYYRYSFAGVATTAAVSAAGDYVDVK